MPAHFLKKSGLNCYSSPNNVHKLNMPPKVELIDMAWFSLIKNEAHAINAMLGIDMDRLKEEVDEINAMIEEYEMERDSARDKLDGIVYNIGKKILDGELYVDKDIRRMAEDMQRKSGFDTGEFDLLQYYMNRRLGIDEE